MSGFRTGCFSVMSWVHMTHRFLTSRLMSVPCQMMSRISSRCCWRSLRVLKGCRFLKPLRVTHRNEVHLSTLWRSELHWATNHTCLIFLCYFYSSVSDSVKANSRHHVSLPTQASIGKHSQTDCHIRTIMTMLCFAPCPVEDKHSAWENTILIFHSLEASRPAIQTHRGINTETRETVCCTILLDVIQFSLEVADSPASVYSHWMCLLCGWSGCLSDTIYVSSASRCLMVQQSSTHE